MKKILLADSSILKTKLINQKFAMVFLLEDIVIENENIELISLHKYFIKSHKTARNFNRILLKMDNSLNLAMHLSLMKLSDEIIFKIIRILEILKDIKFRNPDSEIIVNTVYNSYLLSFSKLLNQDLQNVVINETFTNVIKTNTLKTIMKIFILVINFFRISKKNFENIFFLYNDKIAFEFAKPYIDDNLVLYPFFSPGFRYKQNLCNDKEYINFKFIILSELLRGIKNYKINKNNLLNSNLPSEIKRIYVLKLFQLELDSIMILSLKHKYKNLKNIIGLFDTCSSIDYVTERLNTLQNIKIICIPHGINFKYKVHYISYGVNVYTFWSQNHLQRMLQSNLINDTKTNKVITGNIVYKNTATCLNKKFKKNRNILVVGEYFASDNFYSSPFNKDTTKELFDVLKDFISNHQDCNITIRTRLNDEYYKVASKYISSQIHLSSPDISMIDEINRNDLVISVFSNALHEALLLEKNVLQVNLLEIENYRDLAEDNLVFYADNIIKIKQILVDWYEDKLPKIDYEKHLKDYTNDNEFTKIDLKALV